LKELKPSNSNLNKWTHRVIFVLVASLLLVHDSTKERCACTSPSMLRVFAATESESNSSEHHEYSRLKCTFHFSHLSVNLLQDIRYHLWIQQYILKTHSSFDS
jgi:hypothetical protein